MTMRAVLPFVAAVMLVLSVAFALPAAAQTYRESLAAYKRGDYATAYRGFRRLAGQGNARAQYFLANMYGKGRGVRRNYTTAVRWYRRSAEQGDVYSQAMLGVHYETGVGVRRNLIYAHKWFSLAISRSTVGQRGVRDYAAKRRNKLARRLTGSALSQARWLARKWRPRKETALRAPPRRNALRPRQVASLQRALARLGYDPGPADGVLGPRSRAAIRAFQASVGLPANGGVSNRLVNAVVDALRRASASGPARRSLRMAGTGSGFRVSARGHILTNAHVVRGCREVRIPPSPNARSRRVAVGARDDGADLALLAGPAGRPFAAFRQGRRIRPAASVIVAGYPLHGLLATGLNVSKGIVSALAGPRNNRRMIQISAPVQRGNSGGPVLDSAGNVVGVVVSKLNALKVARVTGDIPQNVNFAVSAGTARAFLNAEGVAYSTAPSDFARTPEDVAAAARKFTVLVECWK
ncbi:MAG: trypsin-like serine protease [Rhodospirillaceae bacterium]|nr:trypsin-like serine protease [Rhodospirillaceae bacterium]